VASAFGHVVVAYALGKTFRLSIPDWRLWSLTVMCSLLPDVDVVGFFLGIPYEHMWGHRGFTHSIVFAFLVGLVVPRLASPTIPYWTRPYLGAALYFSLVTMSHGFLDSLTDGGLGIAFFAPFDSTRYFFPWRPISVSPIGLTEFFSEWGLGVLLSELLWIGVPVGLWLAWLRVTKRTGTRKSQG
jgi:inner membrane protein